LYAPLNRSGTRWAGVPAIPQGTECGTDKMLKSRRLWRIRETRRTAMLTGGQKPEKEEG
jgi:hypothetical protein